MPEYDPTRPLLDQMVPREDGSEMHHAFVFADCGVAVSVQAGRHCRSSFAAVADRRMVTRYPHHRDPAWFDGTPDRLHNRSLWTPVEFEVAVLRTPRTFLTRGAYRAKFGNCRPMPALYKVDREFRKTGVASFVPLSDVEALLGFWLVFPKIV